MTQDNYSLERIEVIQSYILTTARYDFNVYEKRIMYRLVEMMQFLLNGLKLNERHSIQKDLFDLYHVEIPLRAFLFDEKDTNYSRAKKALTRLTQKVLYYEDDTVWKAIPLILLPEIRKNEGSCKFRLHEDIYNALMNFSKGFKKYELITAMQFESVYSMRFYELFSKQKTPLTYSIAQLKAMFKIEDKYKLPADFIRRVVETAKKELDEKSPYSFDYKPLKTGRQITSIKFLPQYLSKNEDETYNAIKLNELAQQSSVGIFVKRDLKNYLKDNFNFYDREIKNNLDIFIMASKFEDEAIMMISNARAKANRAKNPKGYIINALKKWLKNKELKK